MEKNIKLNNQAIYQERNCTPVCHSFSRNHWLGPLTHYFILAQCLKIQTTFVTVSN